MTKITAIVPSGGRLSPADAAICGHRVKALVQIGGEPLLARLLQVLNAVDSVGEMVVIGPEECRQPAELAGARWTAETNSLLGNVQAGVRASGLTGGERILLIGSDLAAPSADGISDFLARVPDGEQVAAPLVSRAQFDAAYPASRSAFIALKEGEFTLGSQFVAPASLLLAPPTAVAAMLGHRKSQIGMAVTFGLPFAIGLVTRQLTIPALERRASQMLTVPATAVSGCAPDLALDIDIAADYQYAVSLAVKSGLPKRA